ncbi:hypothetical protein B0J13DRAFT_601630 [Dactylonectria estremocensis]|uniref:Uncharacterized protein n=1 Tax=Dactylonectria estremocensis TaxID=1079267 RepID=A0A9P9FKD2_9HYPO|nr:hypothetical protein B0J13DRAFT_601630 [Dactylonectria estremocensis]
MLERRELLCTVCSVCILQPSRPSTRGRWTTGAEGLAHRRLVEAKGLRDQGRLCKGQWGGSGRPSRPNQRPALGSRRREPPWPDGCVSSLGGGRSVMTRGRPSATSTEAAGAERGGGGPRRAGVSSDPPPRRCRMRLVHHSRLDLAAARVARGSTAMRMGVLMSGEEARFRSPRRFSSGGGRSKAGGVRCGRRASGRGLPGCLPGASASFSHQGHHDTPLPSDLREPGQPTPDPSSPAASRGGQYWGLGLRSHNPRATNCEW